MGLLERGFFASIIILVIITCRALLINKLPKKVFLILWYLALFRLLIPYSFSSIFSIYSFLGQEIVLTPVIETDIEIDNKKMQENQKGKKMQKKEENQKENFIKGNKEWYKKTGKLIWFLGVIIYMIIFLSIYYLYYRKFRFSLPVENKVIKEWLKTHKIRRHISIRQIKGISSPLTYGIIKPVILMPKEIKWENSDQIKYILEHEFIHIKRLDAITKLCFMIAVCIYWFHPLVYLMYFFVNKDIELSCDEAVVKHFGKDSKSSYALTLIAMEEMKNNLFSLENGFHKGAAEERIIAIMKIKKVSVISYLLAIVLVFGIFLIFATSPIKIKADKFTEIVSDKKIEKFPSDHYDNIKEEDKDREKENKVQEEYESVLGEIAVEIAERGDYEVLNHIIYYLQKEDLNKVIKKVEEKGDDEELEYLYLCNSYMIEKNKNGGIWYENNNIF